MLQEFVGCIEMHEHCQVVRSHCSSARPPGMVLSSVPPPSYQAAEAEKFLEDSNEGEFEVAVCHRINHRVQRGVEVAWNEAR